MHACMHAGTGHESKLTGLVSSRSPSTSETTTCWCGRRACCLLSRAVQMLSDSLSMPYLHFVYACACLCMCVSTLKPRTHVVQWMEQTVFRLMCILSGCDYLPTHSGTCLVMCAAHMVMQHADEHPKGVSLKMACSYCCLHRDRSKLLRVVRAKHNMPRTCVALPPASCVISCFVAPLSQSCIMTCYQGWRMLSERRSTRSGTKSCTTPPCTHGSAWRRASSQRKSWSVVTCCPASASLDTRGLGVCRLADVRRCTQARTGPSAPGHVPSNSARAAVCQHVPLRYAAVCIRGQRSTYTRT